MHNAITPALIDKRYPFKVWITTLVLAALLIVIGISIDDGETGDLVTVIQLYLFLLLFAGGFSLPVLLVYYYIFKGLVYVKLSPLYIKLLLMVVAIIGMLATCVLIGISVSTFGRQLIILGSYAISIIIASLLYNTHKQHTSGEPTAQGF